MKATVNVSMEAGKEHMSQNKLAQIPDELYGNGHARISANIGYSYDFGRGKCSVLVSLACNQDTDTIEQAVDIAMQIADTCAAEGMEIVAKRLEEP